MRALFLGLWHDGSGATAIEYALIAILISVAAIAGMGAIGTWLNKHLFGIRLLSGARLRNPPDCGRLIDDAPLAALRTRYMRGMGLRGSLCRVL
jgi:Flp pilus assembly pilin Flp